MQNKSSSNKISLINVDRGETKEEINGWRNGSKIVALTDICAPMRERCWNTVIVTVVIIVGCAS